MVWASRGPPGKKPLGGLSGRLGGLLGCLGAIFSVLERSLGVLGPSWPVLEASWGPLGPTSRPVGPKQVTQEDAGRTRGDAGNPGNPRGDAEPFKNFSGVRAVEAQRRVRGPENTPTLCLKARWWIACIQTDSRQTSEQAGPHDVPCPNARWKTAGM